MYPTPGLSQILHQHLVRLRAWLLQRFLARRPRKRPRNRRRYPHQSKHPFWFYSRRSDNYIHTRQLCFSEWKQKNENVPDDEFKEHWNSLSRSEKTVSNILWSRFTLSHILISRTEVRQEGKETRTLLSPLLLLPLLDITLPGRIDFRARRVQLGPPFLSLDACGRGRAGCRGPRVCGWMGRGWY